jgi:hypothetical protein
MLTAECQGLSTAGRQGSRQIHVTLFFALTLPRTLCARTHNQQLALLFAHAK